MKHTYSDEVTNKKIAILGLTPPPYGGVSVHISRVADKLTDQGNAVYHFCIEQRLRGKLFLFYMAKFFAWLMWRRPAVVYYHGTYIKNCVGDLLILKFFALFKKYDLVIVEHDCRHLYKRTRLFKWVYRKIVKSAQVVLIGSTAQQSYQDNNIVLQKSSVESAFLPPVISMASIIEEQYPSFLFTFIKTFTPIILMNGAHIMLIDGKDIYGFDQAIEMLALIKAEYPDAGLIIAIAQMNDKAYEKKLYARMQELKIAEQVFILQGQKELWPLFKRVDLFIRPTLSDGYSVSLDEACFFKVPSIASDVAKRPISTVVYKISSISNLIKAVKSTLNEQVYAKINHISDSVHP